MCLIFKFLYWLFPIRGFRAAILKYHIDHCSCCQEKYDIEDQTKDILAVPDWIKTEPSLWPQVKQKMVLQEDKITRNPKRSFFTTKWQWATVALFFVAIVTWIIWNQQSDVKKIILDESESAQEITQVTIKHAELNGKNATSYVYQTQKISFIWFSETEKNEE
jgi:hypothetical protein